MDSYRKYSGKMLDGRYLLEEPVGMGGMAVVFSAIDKMTGRRVAIKMLRETAATEQQILRRFINESRAVSMFNHNNIVKIYDVSVEGQFKYIVMEYIDGMTLRDYMDYKRPIDWRDAVIYIDQILRALSHAHLKGVIHRDIKPQNIMLLEGGYVKVMDFGIAKILDAKDQTLNTNTAIGTVYYLSPEQARNKKIDCRSDIYSLGCMLYEMVTGKLPFIADSPVSVVLKQINDQPTPPSQINPKIPLGLEQIILCAMQKNPQDRYQTASAMLRDIRQFQNDPTIVFVMKKPAPKTPSADTVIKNTEKTVEAPAAEERSQQRFEQQPQPPHNQSPIREREQIRQQPQQQQVRPQPAQRQAPYSQQQRAQQHTTSRQQIPPRSPQNQRPQQYQRPQPQQARPPRPVNPNTQRKRKNSSDTMSLSTAIFILIAFLVLVSASLFLIFNLLSKNISSPLFDEASIENTVCKLCYCIGERFI